MVRWVHHRRVAASRSRNDVTVPIPCLSLISVLMWMVCEVPSNMSDRDHQEWERRKGGRGDSLDDSRVHSRDSLHVLFDEVAMVILDLLATVPVEVESVHMVVGGVGQNALLECDFGRWRRDMLLAVLVLATFPSCFENFDFTRGDGVYVVARATMPLVERALLAVD